MKYTILALAAAITTVMADDCQSRYTQCMAIQGASETACQCDMTTCLGEDNARNRAWCASATANSSTTGHSATSSVPHSTSSPATIIGGTAGSQPSGQPPINAAPGSLDLGAICSDNAQCHAGVQCYASNAGLIRQCGNFNAACTTNAQCAYNTCSNGLCSGYLATSANATLITAGPTGTGVVPSNTGSPTSSLTPFTGSASMSSIMSGFAAVFFGVVAWVL